MPVAVECRRGGPADAELVAAGRQLADEVLEVAVVGVAAGLGAQGRRRVPRPAAPSRGRTRAPPGPGT